MKKIFLLFFIWGLLSCCPPLEEGYLVGKKHIPAHSKTVLIGKRMYLQSVPERYTLYFALEERTQTVTVSKQIYDTCILGKLYKIKRE